MSKNKHTETNSNNWLDEMTKNDKKIDMLLDTFIDIASTVVDELNKRNKNALEDGRKLLIDSPIKVECQCGENCQLGDECHCNEEKSLSTELNVKNSINASDLKLQSTMSTKKRAENLLENIFALIVDVNEDGEKSVVVDLIEELDEEFFEDDISEQELEDIMDILYSYLTEKGFEVEGELTTVSEDDVDSTTATLEISW